MNISTFSSEVLTFCKSLSTASIQKLPFQKAIFPGIENKELVAQAICYQSAKDKLPEWCNSDQVIFPDKTSVEQCTSEWVARWKSTLVTSDCHIFIDATAGLGVDAFYLGLKTNQKHLFEIEADRREALIHNLAHLGFSDFEVHEISFENYLQSDPKLIQANTLVYVDPDRRPLGADRKWNWAETEPNIENLYRLLKSTGSRFMVKLSPMDNPMEVANQMPGAESIYTVSLHNEVKEVLMIWNFSISGIQTKKRVVEISKSGLYREIELPVEPDFHPVFSKPIAGQFLLDPWAAIRKGFQSAAWMQGQGFGMISVETQLYLADEKPLDFPGRVFQIEEVMTDLKTFGKQHRKADFHVVARAYPESAESIKKKFGWSPSGEQFVFCYQSPDKQNVYLRCTRMENEPRSGNWVNL